MAVAMYRSACAADCGQAIQPGELIARVDGDDWAHGECVDAFADMDFSQDQDHPVPEDKLPRLDPKAVICTECWLVQPCDCERENQ